MFEYFPKNYVWNLSVAIAIESGAQIGEIDEMCRPIRDAAARGEDAGTGDFLKSWVAMADRLSGLAAEDEAAGRNFSAATKLDRASLYYQIGERMQAHGAPARAETYRKSLDAFVNAARLGKYNLERVKIPYAGGAITGWLMKAERAPARAPAMVYVNGFDSTKELLVWSRLGRELARRGISTLHIDQPGTGEALRLNDQHATYDSERWASKVFDYLETRDDVDTSKVGMVGISLGGYYTPRAVAFEPRYALGAVWGANHNWGEVQRKRARNEGDRPVPHYWAHALWVWNAADMAAFEKMWDQINLDGVVEKIRVPFLVTHGANDRQISVEYAHRTFDQLTNSPKRELKIFTEREGGIEHVSVDNMANARDFIADWIAETFGGRVS